ncbi:uncharacterized protein C8Q71DRAFT_838244 [Rhodofomes roseus]|uniref:BTB domain-containing protein n=1 Tax=Rhodofomes roseus TaxID=34475 RepID=A0ABQ8KAN8_9APHY|nr:uncharacterized protein C8Q71DRAFT_838244 [Rhodofomes roseus]KAH9834005.1 hypothetical protein C8Q71DRAFT_838244 [Rhodofomes roseus]
MDDAQAPGELNVQTAALVPDEELWFPDGNVVLEAQGHAFRVYQGLLGYNSEVFRDLFTVPQPPSAETFDGCPMVHLTDHPEELRHLLRVIFDGKKYYPHHVRLDFSVVAALIRLSHKYQIQYVHEDYLSRMKSCFCTDADQWNEAYIKYGSSSMAYVNTDAIQAVNIARLTDTVSILPSALLVCCHLDANELLNGSRRLDDNLERLSKQDIASCINARQEILYHAIKASMEFLLTPGIPHPEECETQDRCRDCIERLRAIFLEMHTAGGLLSTAFLTRTALIRGNRLCGNCRDALCKDEAEVQPQRHLWAELPGLLGIEKPVRWPEAPGQ